MLHSMIALVLALSLSQTPQEDCAKNVDACALRDELEARNALQPPARAETLEEAREACVKDFNACKRVRVLEAQERERQRVAGDQAIAKLEAQRQAVMEQARVEAEQEAQREAALKAKCGKDYQRVRVGMKLDRAEQCAGPLALTAEDQRGSVYEGAGGVLRVEHGIVVKWVAR